LVFLRKYENNEKAFYMAAWSVMDLSLVIFSYMLGSIPFGLVVARLSGKGDLRTQGSGNIGATNVVRVVGKKQGALTLLLDAGKGALAVVAARWVSGDSIALFAGVSAVIGHVFPVLLSFKGGKGVATTMAVLIALSPIVGLATGAIWLLVFFTTRLSSLSAILSMMAAPSIAFLFSEQGATPLVFATLFLGALVILRHRSNIRRLINGEEKRF
jgi:glycerol-3-phosphate acyltransferase PlsY